MGLLTTRAGSGRCFSMSGTRKLTGKSDVQLALPGMEIFGVPDMRDRATRRAAVAYRQNRMGHGKKYTPKIDLKLERERVRNLSSLWATMDDDELRSWIRRHPRALGKSERNR